jgi:hypothetical protein
MGDDSSALQLSLPEAEAWEIQALTAEDQDARPFQGCTGEGIERIRRLRVQVVELTVAGVGVKRTAAALGISPAAVRAVRARAWERGELDPMKQRLGRQYLATADLLPAEALERIDEIPAQVLLLASAQAADKGQLLTGGVTARVELVQVPADLHDLIDALPIDVTPVESPGVGLQKGGDSPGAAVEVEASPADAADSVSPGLSSERVSGESRCASPDASGGRADPAP